MRKKKTFVKFLAMSSAMLLGMANCVYPVHAEQKTDLNQKDVKELTDEEIQKIAWKKYGYRTGFTGQKYNAKDLGVNVPSTLTSTVSTLKYDYYNQLISYLSN